MKKKLNPDDLTPKIYSVYGIDTKPDNLDFTQVTYSLYGAPFTYTNATQETNNENNMVVLYGAGFPQTYSYMAPAPGDPCVPTYTGVYTDGTSTPCPLLTEQAIRQMIQEVLDKIEALEKKIEKPKKPTRKKTTKKQTKNREIK